MTAFLILLVLVNGLVVYTWLLYPALLALLTRGRRQGQPEPPAELGEAPRVAFILSAYNEETDIGERVRNLLTLDYPAGRLHAYIGVDGARDRTAQVAAAAAEGHPEVKVFDFAQNRGKVPVLKELVSRAYAETAPEILVFTDANTMFDADALLRLTRHFADASVGGVCGRLILLSGGAETEENVYWRLESWLKARQSQIDSCPGANGAIYAIRSSLFWKEIPANTIIDDFVIGMKVREQHYRFVYDADARATEVLPPSVADEWKRRVRIGAGDFQALLLCAPCLSPRYGVFAWMYWSNRVLRWFTPHLLLAGFLLSAAAFVFGMGVWGIVFLGGYAAFGAAALIGRLFRSRRFPGMKPFRIAEYFLTMQCAIFAGFLRFCGGNLEGRWQRSARV